MTSRSDRSAHRVQRLMQGYPCLCSISVHEGPTLRPRVLPPFQMARAEQASRGRLVKHHRPRASRYARRVQMLDTYLGAALSRDTLSPQLQLRCGSKAFAWERRPSTCDLPLHQGNTLCPSLPTPILSVSCL